jgi:hypothetical protein
MFQIIDSITTTCMRFVRNQGPWVVVAVVALAVIVIALPIITRILRGGGPK